MSPFRQMWAANQGATVHFLLHSVLQFLGKLYIDLMMGLYFLKTVTFKFANLREHNLSVNKTNANLQKV